MRIIDGTADNGVRERSPSPYGVFSIVVDDLVLSHRYQPRKRLMELLDAWGRSRGRA